MLFEFRDEFADQAAIAVNSADQHRLLSISADHRFDFANRYLRQQSGFFVQILGHGRETWGDNTAHVISFSINHVKGHRCSEINHDSWSAKMMSNRDRIGQSIRADRL